MEFTWLLSGAGDLRDEVLEAVRVALGGPGDLRRLRIALLFEFVFELPQLAYPIVTAAPESDEAAAVQLRWWMDRAREGLVALDA
jgi:hypothetical protein